MNDPYACNRDFFTGEPIRDASEWSDWDFVLVSAFELLNDLTDGDGNLAYEVESERVDVEAVKKINKFHASRDRQTSSKGKKGYTPSPGEYFVPKVRLRGGTPPTIQEYWERLAEMAEMDREDGYL